MAERWGSCSCVVLDQPGCYGNRAGQRVLLLEQGSGSLEPLEGPWESSALPLAPPEGGPQGHLNYVPMPIPHKTEHSQDKLSELRSLGAEGI